MAERHKNAVYVQESVFELLTLARYLDHAVREVLGEPQGDVNTDAAVILIAQRIGYLTKIEALNEGLTLRAAMMAECRVKGGVPREI